MTHSGKKWKVVFNTFVYSDFNEIDQYFASKIKSAIDSRLTQAPEMFGFPLRGDLKNFRRLRVGDYRIIFSVSGTKNMVLIQAVGHRKEIYDIAKKRLDLS
jgi:mRNA interferase RelE/StbE